MIELQYWKKISIKYLRLNNCFIYASSDGTEVERLPHHPKVKGLNLDATSCTRRKKIVKKMSHIKKTFN
jgi:hypothetical protein